MSKKLLSIILCFSMVLSCLTIGAFTSQAATNNAQAVAAAASSEVGADYGLVDDVQDGQILQCWNWSYSGIKSNMKKIAEQGFSAIQTSPVQTIKETTRNRTMKGSWWVYYQPSNFNIDTSSQNALGTKSDFKAMCDEAHKYGVKVIVDAVLNHMANRSGNDLSDTIPSDIRNDSSCWHSITQNTSNWNSRWDITHNCMDGLPDLNTGNSKIQNYCKNFLKECVAAGADGFRFDGAKHIEVPNDAENAGSNFWPNVLNATTSYAKSTRGFTPYYYGEILDSTGGVGINQYTQYMSVTDNGSSNDIRNCVNSGNATGAANSYIGKGSAANKTVQWNESHDTYANGSSSGVSDNKINKTWAMVGSRAEVCGMYLARPRNYNDQIGTAGVTAWANKEVQAVNQFKNYFAGQTEYLSSSGSIAYNERGTEGVVLVNCNGGSQNVSVSAHKMKSGTYKDQITGNTFTVSGGQIKGQIGSTGIAVVYNAKPAGPAATVTPGSSTYKTDTLTLTLNYNSTATSGQYSVDGGAYTSFTNGQKITIGSGVAFGTKTTVSVKASNASATSDVVTYTYTKVDPSAVQMVYFDNSSYNWSSVYAYIYTKAGDNVNQNAEWPGVKMEKNSQGLYELEVPESLANGMVIFTESYSATTNRYPADGEDGVRLNGNSMIMKANHVWAEYIDVTPTTAQPTTAQPTTAQPTTAQPTTQPQERVLMGDVNMDKVITVDDATLIQMYAADLTSLTGNALRAADVDGDGVVTVMDATAVQCYIVELYNSAGNCGRYSDGTEPTTQPATQPTTAQPTTTQPTTTQPTTTQPQENYIYASGYTHAYFWSESDVDLGGAWPGIAMESIGNNVYRVEIPSGAENVIFSNSGNSQTSDLTIPGANKIYQNGSWSDYNGSSQPTTPVDPENYVGYDNSSTNWGTVYAYFWSDSAVDIGGAWPRTAMTKSSGNVYTIAVPAGATKVIFTNGSAKTGDLNVHLGGTYNGSSWS